jgi:hypothetical protein
VPIDKSPKEVLDWRFRLLVAVSIGAVAGAYCYAAMSHSTSPNQAADFTWYWLAARALIQRHDPYVAVQAGGVYQLVMPWIYPLTTAVLVVPFALVLNPVLSASAFITLSAALLSWCLSREGYSRFPIFLSVPFLWAANSGQLSPLMTASALVPWLGWIAPVKPNLGIATLAYRPARIAIIGSVVFVLFCFAIQPNWLIQWIQALPNRPAGVYRSPLLATGGFAILLVLLRWKRPETRLLLALAVVPQNLLFYDQLLLWLIPQTWKESALLSVLSFVALFAGNSGFSPTATNAEVVGHYAPMINAFLFLPCVIMILRRRQPRSALADSQDGDMKQ